MSAAAKVETTQDHRYEALAQAVKFAVSVVSSGNEVDTQNVVASAKTFAKFLAGDES